MYVDTGWYFSKKTLVYVIYMYVHITLKENLQVTEHNNIDQYFTELFT